MFWEIQKEALNRNDSFIFKLNSYLYNEWKVKVLRWIWGSEGGEVTQ
jgi:hypothetical protein